MERREADVDLSGAVYTYKYQDGMLTLEETTGDTLVFIKSDAAGGSLPDEAMAIRATERRQPFRNTGTATGTAGGS